MPDDFKGDRFPDSNFSRGNLLPPVLPATLKDGEFAFVVQRALYPSGFKGTIQLQTIEGSIPLKPYLDPLKTRLDDLEVSLLEASTKKEDPVAVKRIEALEGKIKELEAKLEDKELPRLVLLDEISDVTKEGLQTVSMRIYADD